MTVRLHLSWILCLLIVQPLTAADTQVGITFEPCHLSNSQGNGSLYAECARWQQPLNRQDPDAESIELSVVRLPATAVNPAKDAFTVINGGPGGSSIDLLVDLAPVLQSFTRQRDVIVLDQRGTGRSTPLICDAVADGAETLTEAQTIALTQDCLNSLLHDPRYFTTSVAVKDLEELRQVMGYEQLSLYGVSYGTRVVTQYMRRYPSHARAAVIDGVVPPTMALGTEVAQQSDAALRRVFERCQQNEACASAFPTIARDFDRLRRELTDAPTSLTFRHPISGQQTELTFGYGHLAIWIRLALYAPETTALIPLIIDQAANHANLIPVAAASITLLEQLTGSLNYGMHNAVVCTEDAPFFDQQIAADPALSASYLGADMYQTLTTLCSVWPAGVRDDNLKSALHSDVPTLVLSGEFDPITPPAYGDQTLPGLTRAKHIVAPGQGHGTIARGCMPQVILQFIEQPEPDQLDAACVQHLTSFPFFVDPLGPAP